MRVCVFAEWPCKCGNGSGVLAAAKAITHAVSLWLNSLMGATWSLLAVVRVLVGYCRYSACTYTCTRVYEYLACGLLLLGTVTERSSGPDVCQAKASKYKAKLP